MQNLNINQLLKDTLEAIQPIAKHKSIRLIFETTNPTFYTNLPMDEVLAPVLCLVVRLLYIIPKGHPLIIKTLQQEGAENTFFLRIELKTLLLPFNPNLIFRPDNKRFKVEHSPKHSIIFIEWALNNAITEAIPSSIPNAINASGTYSNDNDATLSSSLMVSDGVIERLKAFGKSPFIQGKLKATKGHKQQQLLDNIISIILNNLGNHDFNSEHLEKQLGLSKSQLFRNLKELTGYSTANYIRYIRLSKAAELLETTDLSISEITDKVGFNELSYFSSSFIETFDRSPTAWRKAKKGNNSINAVSKG